MSDDKLYTFSRNIRAPDCQTDTVHTCICKPKVVFFKITKAHLPWQFYVKSYIYNILNNFQHLLETKLQFLNFGKSKFTENESKEKKWSDISGRCFCPYHRWSCNTPAGFFFINIYTFQLRQIKSYGNSSTRYRCINVDTSLPIGVQTESWFSWNTWARICGGSWTICLKHPSLCLGFYRFSSI